MIELSLTEIVLFAWAVIATGYALRYKAERGMVASILQQLVENEDLYHRIRNGWSEAQKMFVKN